MPSNSLVLGLELCVHGTVAFLQFEELVTRITGTFMALDSSCVLDSGILLIRSVTGGVLTLLERPVSCMQIAKEPLYHSVSGAVSKGSSQ